MPKTTHCFWDIYCSHPHLSYLFPLFLPFTFISFHLDIWILFHYQSFNPYLSALFIINFTLYLLFSTRTSAFKIIEVVPRNLIIFIFLGMQVASLLAKLFIPLSHSEAGQKAVNPGLTPELLLQPMVAILSDQAENESDVPGKYLSHLFLKIHSFQAYGGNIEFIFWY